MPSPAASVAAHKEEHPELYCPDTRCLWRTGGGACPRHPRAAVAAASFKKAETDKRLWRARMEAGKRRAAADRAAARAMYGVGDDDHGGGRRYPG